MSTEAKNRAYVRAYVGEAMAITYRLRGMKVGKTATIRGKKVTKIASDDYVIDGKLLHTVSASNLLQGPPR
jgi:hypothetical protein